MAEAVAPLIGKSVDLFFSQTYQELQYLWKFRSNIQRLSSTMASLERRREAISLLINAAKNNAEVIGPDVEPWLQKFELMKKEVDVIIQGKAKARMSFFKCKFPNLKVRYSLSKKAATKTIEIVDLEGKGEFSQVGYPAPIGQMPFTSPLEVVVFESRLRVEERVMKALLDEKISVIAVCGMGGVGKTTMVKKVADEIKKDKLFDEVVMAVVSQDFDRFNIQQQLAEKLGLEIKETTIDARADRLHTRLMDQGKRILLIIDDLWKDIDLRAIGLPSKDERKGLKVLLTSRFSRVCSKMDVKEIIEIGVLIEKEAWGLFKKHSNITDDGSDALEGYPKLVSNKCQGLPLAIEVIGKTLKDMKRLSEWRDALHQLENGQDSGTSKDVQDKVYSSIAWSVNYLEREQKSLLLLCALFPEDYEIEVEDLVRYAKGSQLLKGTDQMSQTRDRVEKIIHELTDCYLLIACDNHHVKLHDVVRDTCLRIASEGDNLYMVSHSWLKEWPDKDTYEYYTAISLAFDHLNKFPSGFNCSSLQLLRLSFRGSEIMNIITSLMQVAENIRVLNINDSGIELPPQSLKSSLSLRTLNLHNCILVGDLSALLESLVKVEVLSFYKSSYEGNWPKEIADLSNLKVLDLRFRYGPVEAFPTGILIHLKKLEELYLGRVIHMELPESIEIISEISSLPNLKTIEILGCDSHGLAVLVKNMNVERLLRFYVSPFDEIESPYQFSRTMIVHETNFGTLLEPKMKAFLSRVDEYFELWRVTGYNNDLVKDFNGGSVFSRIRSLELRSCEIKYICNTSDSYTREGVFRDLETLFIQEAKHLEELCHGNIPPDSFARLEEVILVDVPLLSCLWRSINPPCLGNLTRLVIQNGHIIRCLFMGSSVHCFPRLRVIDVDSCPMLETLVSYDDQIKQDTVEDKPQFPALEEVRLQEVTRFKTLYSEPEVLSRITNSNLSVFPKLRILKIHGSRGFNVVDIINNGQNLSSLEMSHCFLEVCFDFEGWRKETTGEVAERVFNNMDSVSLIFIPNLRHLWRNLPRGTFIFQNLATLFISACGSLKYLLTPSMAKKLPSLKRLCIFGCKNLKAIVGLEETPEKVSVGERIFDRLEHLDLRDLPLLRNFERMVPEGTIGFQKLMTLEIGGCGGLRYLVTRRVAKMFVSLKTLEIELCHQLYSIIGNEDVDESTKNEEEMMFPELCDVRLTDLPELRMICSQSADLVLPSWKYFVVDHCPRINKFCAGNVIAPELKQVKFMKYSFDEIPYFYLDLETTRKWFKNCELGKLCIDCAVLGEKEACHHLSEGSSTNKNNEDDTDNGAEGSDTNCTHQQKEEGASNDYKHNIDK